MTLHDVISCIKLKREKVQRNYMHYDASKKVLNFNDGRVTYFKKNHFLFKVEHVMDHVDIKYQMSLAAASKLIFIQPIKGGKLTFEILDPYHR